MMSKTISHVQLLPPPPSLTDLLPGYLDVHNHGVEGGVGKIRGKTSVTLQKN